MKKMLINAIHPEEIRVAVVEDSSLHGLFMESSMKEQLKGSIFKGKVSRIEPGLNSVFVDFGREKNGFLPVSDIISGFIPGYVTDKPLISQLLEGMEIMVQVSREEKGTKGALLTMNISLPGRYMVLLPKQDSTGISRRIDDEQQRARLKDIMSQLKVPDETGLIVRTAGMDRNKTEFSRDLNYLIKLWKSIDKDFNKATAPALIYKESDVVIRSIRDYYTADISEILIDDEETFKQAAAFMKRIMPRHTKIIKRYKETRPIFSKHELEKQVQSMYQRKVKLRSGASIVIDQTEAMVAIDVNSGHLSEKDMENTAFSTNLEAVGEIARQIVLRDLGGLIVIDFIDMKSRENVRKIEKALKDAMKDDRAQFTIGRISDFGLLALSRERMSPALLEKSHLICPHCEGTGMIRSSESSSFMALRDIHLHLNKSKKSRIIVNLNEDAALYLLNQHRKYLSALEKDFSTEILINRKPGMKQGEIEFEEPGAEKE